MKKWKIKRNIKNFCAYVGVLFQLPHFWTIIILIVLAIISLIVSYNLQENYPFSSAVFSNVFAGLVTGIAICLISGLKSFSQYNIEKQISWLNQLHDMIMDFNKAHRALLSRDLSKAEKLFDEIYDVLCLGAAVNSFISQGQFNKALPFNPYSYSAKKLNYDTLEYEEKFSLIRDDIIELDVEHVTKRKIIDLFQDMERPLLLLNGRVLAKTKELETKKNIINKFIV